MQKKKKKTKLFIFLIICFVLVPFLLTKGCNYMESLNQAKNSVSEPISSISEQIQPSASVYTHAHTHSHTHSRPHYAGAHVYAQAHSISKANWSGTAVPDNGYVENVYVNTNLSKEDVFALLEPILSNLSELGLYENYVFVNEDFSKLIGYSSSNVEGGQITNISILYNFNQTEIVIFDSVNGFRNDFNGIIEVNAVSVYGATMEQAGLSSSNALLSDLFSITPFEQSSNNELSIGNLFTQLGNAIIIFGGAVVNVFISMEPIFWNEGPTLIFILLIASVSFALVFWGIELLISLIGVFKTKRKKKK